LVTDPNALEFGTDSSILHQFTINVGAANRHEVSETWKVKMPCRKILIFFI
jgi:hypothetical protein